MIRAKIIYPHNNTYNYPRLHTLSRSTFFYTWKFQNYYKLRPNNHLLRDLRLRHFDTHKHFNILYGDKILIINFGSTGYPKLTVSMIYSRLSRHSETKILVAKCRGSKLTNPCTEFSRVQRLHVEGAPFTIDSIERVFATVHVFINVLFHVNVLIRMMSNPQVRFWDIASQFTSLVCPILFFASFAFNARRAREVELLHSTVWIFATSESRH